MENQNIQILSEIIGHRSAVELGQKYNTLNELTKADVMELQQIPGVGPAKARSIKAALELAARVSREILGESPILDTPEKVADYFRDEIRPYRTEQFKVVLLNTRRRLIRVIDIASGTLDMVLVHAREVFRQAITYNAAAVVLIHNHPGSGFTTPSDADIKVTRDLIRAGQLLKIEVLDHVVLGNRMENQPKDYASLRELGYFYS